MNSSSGVGLIGCSDPCGKDALATVDRLTEHLKSAGLKVFRADYPGSDIEPFSSEAACAKAQKLIEMYKDPRIGMIFDISGGDLANSVLPYLDFSVIRASSKPFAGYSDLTTLVNAISVQTGRTGILYQIRNLVDPVYGEEQTDRFLRTFISGTEALFDFDYQFLHGSDFCGELMGGNIRCLLKLAGTTCWPDFTGRILFLESLGAMQPQLITAIAQLKMLGVFEQISGLVLGTFTRLEFAGVPVWDMIRGFIPDRVPVVKTSQIGHGHDSRALKIGGFYSFLRRRSE